MSSSRNAEEILDREYLELRAKILELAASFDRLDRSSGSVGEDPRMQLLLEGIAILSQEGQGRAEQVQLLFSRDYAEDWRETFNLPAAAET